MHEPRQSPILWDIYEELLDEAGFLWARWECALLAPNYTAAEVVAGPQERLAAHLDALVVGGRDVAERLLLPVLASGDTPAQVSAAAWSLLQAQDADHLDQVLRAWAGAEPRKAQAIARAMGLCRHPAIVPRLSALWAHAAGDLRAMILDIVRRHDQAWAQQRVPEALRGTESSLLVVAFRVLRQTPKPDPSFMWLLEEAMSSPIPELRDEALVTGVVLKSRRVADVCRRVVGAGELGSLPYALLAISSDPADRQLLLRQLDAPPSAQPALFALGFAGDLSSAEAALSRMVDPELGASAAESFGAITGVAIDGSFRAPRVEAEVGLDDPPPEVRPEDQLPLPAVEPLRRWWSEQRGRFHPQQRYIAGTLRTPESMTRFLHNGPMWRRSVVALELAVASGKPITIDPSGWVPASA